MANTFKIALSYTILRKKEKIYSLQNVKKEIVENQLYLY